MVKIKVLAIKANVGSIFTQGRQIVIKPHAIASPLKVRGVGGVMSKYLGSAVKIGVTQIRLDTRLLGDRWKAVLEQLLTSDWS